MRLPIPLLVFLLALSGCREPSPAGPRSSAEERSAEVRADASPVRVEGSAPAAPVRSVAAAPVVIPDCRLKVLEKEEVPSQREGVLLFIGTEVADGEDVPADRLITTPVAGERKRYRRLKEGDTVAAGQLVARLDNRLAQDEWAIRKGKLAVAEAELAIAEKARDEAKDRYETEAHLLARKSTAPEQVRAAKLTWEKHHYDAIGKKESLELVRREVHQAETILQMYDIRSAIPGVIRSIYKSPGEALKAFEPVMQVWSHDRLQVEGQAGLQELPYLRKGLRAVIEPVHLRSPRQELVGHLREVTAVAVGQGSPPLIVSGSEDGTVRGWDTVHEGERFILRHPAPVRALACTPPGAPGKLCLVGLSDGRVYLWDLDATARGPLHQFKDAHRGAVTCAAFSPDVSCCATGGEDRSLCVWDPAAGTLRCRVAAAHRGALTSLQLTPDLRALTAARDNTLRVWHIQGREIRPELTLDSRSGAVTQLGALADGSAVLFDQGKTLRLLGIPEGQTRWVLDRPAAGAGFMQMALLSPDGRLVLSGGGPEGSLQLWRTPAEGMRGRELCQLTGRSRAAPSCAAFAPDSSFVVAGTRERSVLVWPLPSPAEAGHEAHAELTLVEHSVDSSTSQVRVCGEVVNADGLLLPGSTVTLVIYPPKRP